MPWGRFGNHLWYTRGVTKTNQIESMESKKTKLVLRKFSLFVFCQGPARNLFLRRLNFRQKSDTNAQFRLDLIFWLDLDCILTELKILNSVKKLQIFKALFNLNFDLIVNKNPGFWLDYLSSKFSLNLKRKFDWKKTESELTKIVKIQSRDWSHFKTVFHLYFEWIENKNCKSLTT